MLWVKLNQFSNRRHIVNRELGHYNGVIKCAMASKITSLTIVYLSVYSGADQRKHQSSASLAFVRGIHGDRTVAPLPAEQTLAYTHVFPKQTDVLP